MNREVVFEKVKGFIAEVIGEDFIDEYVIERTSTFTGDLEMESIELVEFSEKIKTTFGEEVGFAAWLSNLELERLVSLSVNDVLDYLEECL